jgi:hypothetical protein
MTSHELSSHENDDVLRPGTSVEVANAFLGTWAGGFEVVDSGDWGYRVRRASDAAVLPVSFALSRVRARSRSRYR